VLVAGGGVEITGELELLCIELELDVLADEELLTVTLDELEEDDILELDGNGVEELELLCIELELELELDLLDEEDEVVMIILDELDEDEELVDDILVEQDPMVLVMHCGVSLIVKHPRSRLMPLTHVGVSVTIGVLELLVEHGPRVVVKQKTSLLACLGIVS
jgi:hypothetical protein